MKNKYVSSLFLGIILYSFVLSGVADHLVFKRIITSPDSAEAITIYNPTPNVVKLNNPNRCL